jgi:predicted XRE-type DNA-binding protein
LQSIAHEYGKSRELIRQVLTGKLPYAEIAIQKYNLKINPNIEALGKFGFVKSDINIMVRAIKEGASNRDLLDLFNKNASNRSIFYAFFSSPKLKPLFEQMGINSEDLAEQLRMNGRKNMFSLNDIKKIFEYYETKEQKEIAEIFEASQSLISAVLRGEMYKEEIRILGLKTIE